MKGEGQIQGVDTVGDDKHHSLRENLQVNPEVSLPASGLPLLKGGLYVAAIASYASSEDEGRKKGANPQAGQPLFL